MKITELIEQLTALKAQHGDVEVYLSATGESDDGHDYPLKSWDFEYAEGIKAETFKPRGEYDFVPEIRESEQAKLNEKARPPRIIINY